MKKWVNKYNHYEKQDRVSSKKYDPAILLLGIYPKECKSGFHKNTYTQMFIIILFIITKL
jgi:hypothetical protein